MAPAAVKKKKKSLSVYLNVYSVILFSWKIIKVHLSTIYIEFTNFFSKLTETKQERERDTETAE